MSELEIYYREFCCTGAWAHPEAAECGCRGNGWWSSEVDTWHRCRYHGAGKPHPEDYDPNEEEVTFATVTPAPADAPPLMADDDAPF